MKLDREHLHFLIALESGVKTEFFSALSATKKKLALDLAEAKLLIINDANQLVVAAHTNNIIQGIEQLFNEVANEGRRLIIQTEQHKELYGQTK